MKIKLQGISLPLRLVIKQASSTSVWSVFFVALFFVFTSTHVLAQSRKSTTSRKSTVSKKRTSTAKKAVKPSSVRGNVNKINVSGNRKIEADAIRNKIQSKVGAPLDSEQIALDIQAIFKMGYFYDVKVTREVKGGEVVLNFHVVEKPSMVEIEYRGNDDISDEDLAEASGLKAYEIFDMNRINQATEKLLKLYEDKGYFLARIQPKFEEVEKNESLKVIFDIKENDKVKVKKITFLGNRKVGSQFLKARMQTQEGSFFAFLSGAGSYKQDAFDRDVQILNYVYFNEGYVQVKIDRPQVYVTPDKKNVYITIRVEEGEQFDVGRVDFAGDLLFSKEELFEATEIQNSGTFVYETLQKDLRSLQAKYGDLGYAFANIIPRTQIREKERLVDITFEIDKGNKVYFGQISVTGNTKTRDKVVRRELKIREGELYHETRRRESLENIKRLGYFEEVNFNTSTPNDQPDILNIDIVVKERNTGSIQIGAGYSTYANFVFTGRVDQTNLFGKGQKLGISVDLSSKTSLYNLNFTEPYFNDTLWSVGFDLYQSQRSASPYTELKRGGAVRIGHPLAEYLRGYLRYKLDNTELSLNDETDPDLYPVETANGVTSSLTGILEYDKRDDSFSPTKGLMSSTWLEYAGVGGNKKYTTGQSTLRVYTKVFWDVVFRNNLTYGFIAAPEGRDPPFNELFLLGGANSLRGYRWFSVGKKKYSSRTNLEYPFGGRQKIVYNGEFEFPMIREAGIKGVLFYDIGQAEDHLMLDSFKQDVGFGFRWFSPIGPLRFEWGFPLQRGRDDDPVNFEFSIGSPF